MYRRLVVAVLLTVACGAPAQVQQGRPMQVYTPTRINVSAADSSAMDLAAGAGADVVPVPLARAWTALPRAYAALDVEVTQQDPTAYAIGGARLRAHGSFGGKSLMQLFDCGETAGVPNASRWDVTMQIGTKLRARGADSTIVATWALATAKPATTAGYDVDCTTKTGLPEIVARALMDAAVAR